MPVSSDSRQSSPVFDARILDRLACPACLGALRWNAPAGQIQCAGCLRAYPVVDGIPVLIAARAVSAP